MKKSNWVIVILAILIGIAIGIYLSTDDEPIDAEQKVRKNKLDLVKNKIKALEERIKDEIAMLKLTAEMEGALSRKVDRICIVLGTIFWSLMILVAKAFYSSGFDLLTSILSTAGLFSLACPLVSIILWRTFDFNSFVQSTRERIKIWLNKKYGHNQDAIVTLTESITIKQQELNALSSSNYN